MLTSQKYILFLVFGVVLSCTFRDRKRSPKPTDQNIIVSRNDPITANRNQEKNTILFKFNSLQQFSCNGLLWNKTLGGEPTQENPLKLTCSDSSYPAGEVTVSLSPVDPATRYQMQLKLNSESGVLDEITLVENDVGPTVINPSTPKNQKLILVRSSLPSASSLLTTYEGDNLPQFSKVPSGCEPKRLSGTVQTGRSPTFFVSNVGTRGFASGKGQLVLGSNNSQSINYPTRLQWGAAWEWSYSFLGKDHTFQIPAPGKFSQLKITQTEAIHLGKPDLISSASEKQLFKSRPFDISWQSSNAPIDSVVEVWISSIINPSSGIICRFKESDKKGLIEANLLQNLQNGYHDIIVYLYSNHSYRKEGEGETVSWFFNSADWRIALVSLI